MLRRSIWRLSLRWRETIIPRFEPNAMRDGGEHLIATMTGTLMAMARREAPSASERVLSPA